MHNQIELSFLSLPENESFARMVISAFLVQADPSMTVVSEVRTAVSEAVTNAVVHAYPDRSDKIVLRAEFDENHVLTIDIEDFGCGIEDIRLAMQPFYTSQPEDERTGIGFALMQSFMDSVHVYSSPGSGTTVRMTRRIKDGEV